MFARISAVFGCHILHVFYTADSLRLACETTNIKTVVTVVAVSRVDVAGTHVHVVGEVAGVHGR